MNTVHARFISSSCVSDVTVTNASVTVKLYECERSECEVRVGDA